MNCISHQPFVSAGGTTEIKKPLPKCIICNLDNCNDTLDQRPIHKVCVRSTTIPDSEVGSGGA